jgi:hypothetical protein
VISADENWITGVFGLRGSCGRGGAAKREKRLSFELFLKTKRFAGLDIAFRA